MNLAVENVGEEGDDAERLVLARFLHVVITKDLGSKP